MRFARAFSMVRTVMRRATPPAALGLIATNRYRPVQPCPRQGAPPPARLACAGSRTHTRPARPRAIGHPLPPSPNSYSMCAQIFAQVSMRAFERGAVRQWGTCFLRVNDVWGQNFLPGLGPRGRTGPLAGYRVCWGVPQRRCMARGVSRSPSSARPTGTAR